MSINYITASEFLTTANRDQAIDIRSADEYKQGHVSGVKNLPIEQVNLDNINNELTSLNIDSNQPVYLLCLRGIRAQKAAELLQTSSTTHQWVVVETGSQGCAECGEALQTINS